MSPPRLRRADAAALLAGLAGLTLWLSLTDAFYRYLRPTMRPWLVAAGVFVAGLALATAVTAWRESRRDGAVSARPSVAGWLLVAPLVIALSTDPGALGAFAVRQQAGGYVPVGDFDLDAHLRSHTWGGQVPSLQLHQFLAAAKGDDDERRLLAATTVRLTGFVVHDRGADGAPDPDGGFTLARLMIGCCAGDASGLVVAVRGHDGRRPDEDAWVEVTGSFDQALTAAQPQDAIAGGVPVLAVSSLRDVDEPLQPYEYPG